MCELRGGHLCPVLWFERVHFLFSRDDKCSGRGFVVRRLRSGYGGGISGNECVHCMCSRDVLGKWS